MSLCSGIVLYFSYGSCWFQNSLAIIFLGFKFLPYVYVWVNAIMCVYHLHVSCPGRPKEHLSFSKTGITGRCEMPCKCCEPDSDLLQEHQVTLSAEPCLQPILLSDDSIKYITLAIEKSSNKVWTTISDIVQKKD